MEEVVAVELNMVLVVVLTCMAQVVVVVVVVVVVGHKQAMLAVIVTVVAVVDCMHSSVRQVPSAQTIVHQQMDQSLEGYIRRCIEVVQTDHEPEQTTAMKSIIGKHGCY